VDLDLQHFRDLYQRVESDILSARFDAANEIGIVIHGTTQAALAEAFRTAHTPNVISKDAPVFRGWSHLADLEGGELQTSGIVAIQPISTVFLKRYLLGLSA